ncbi:MAG TPA: hypothetical protein VK108_09455 [Pseudogracilibacillus sp.]|nr:hypothetical protein [Pseudogracilibacillus sp.]
MNKISPITEKKLKIQREKMQNEEQYTILTGLGWKTAGTLFLTVIAALTVYAGLFS